MEIGGIWGIQGVLSGHGNETMVMSSSLENDWEGQTAFDGLHLLTDVLRQVGMTRKASIVLCEEHGSQMALYIMII